MTTESGKRKPSQERSKSLVESILIAATRIFGTEEYRSATTNRIAELAGVSIGSLYQYFPNKDALISSIVSRHVDGQLTAFEAKIEKFQEGPIDSVLRDQIGQIVAVAFKNQKLHRFLYERGLLLGMSAPVMRTRTRAAELLLKLTAKDPRPLTAAHPKISALIVVNGAMGAIIAAVSGGSDPVDPDDFCAGLVEMGLRTLFGTNGDQGRADSAETS
jgi:AcrR family transcriptional regulator